MVVVRAQGSTRVTHQVHSQAFHPPHQQGCNHHHGLQFDSRRHQPHPADPTLIGQVVKPDRVVEMSYDSEQDEAHHIAALPDAPHLMAVAAAKVVMRNMYNGAMAATFQDASQAYLDSTAHTVVPCQ